MTTSLSDTQRTALHCRTLLVAGTTPHTDEFREAAAALDALVASFVADARQAAVTDAALAVEMVGLADVRRLRSSAPGGRMAS